MGLRKSTSRRLLLSGLLALAALALFIWFVHPFLAISRPVAADTLVVEGWVPEYVAAEAAKEMLSGRYRMVFISGLFFERTDPRFSQGSDSAIVTAWLLKRGVPKTQIEACPTECPSFNRTSHMARAVRDRMLSLKYAPKGVNVITLGPHARQSLLAYDRMLGQTTAVGVISYPKNDYKPERWWASSAGIAKTTKDFAGWLKEQLVGLRS
ncbi:MAG: hypothetical protein QM715_10320 [Nibricoccus sp.]